MPDYDRFGWGGVDYPLVGDTNNTLLQDADPGLFWAREFFAAMLEHYIGSRLVAQATDAGVAIPSAVVHKSNVDPAPYLTQDTRKRYPLLALYRTVATYENRSGIWDHELSKWECAYVMPPLSWDQAEKLLPVFAAVSKIIERACRQGHDPSIQNDRIYWGNEFARLAKIRLVDGRYGRYQDTEGLIHHAWIGSLEVREQERPAEPSNFDSFDGVNIHEDIKDGDGTTLQDVVVISSQGAPTVTGVSPSSGSHLGGDTITVTGTLFSPGASVLVGGTECTAVVVSSATQLTCVTPPHVADLVDVTVTNLDGQSGSVEDAFTFT